MKSTYPAGRNSRFLAVVSAGSALALASTVLAQTYSASDNVFAPTAWTLTVKGTNASQVGTAEQVVNGYATGSNARLSTVNPAGFWDTWSVSIFDNFSYDPSVAPGYAPDVTISFDSRWVLQAFSGVGPAIRQGSNIWAGYHVITGGWNGLNTPSWANYSFSGWAYLLQGTGSMPGPDFSASAAPIYFGFYQRNGGGGPNGSEFANFSVSVTVPAPGALPMLAAIIVGCRGRRRRLTR
jgi:hypothetical protein